MHHRRWQRAFAALVATWFVLVMVEPGVLHSCPVHAGHGPRPTAAAHGGDQHAGHEAFAVASDVPGDAAHGTHQAPPSDGDHGPCTCANDCSAGRTTAALGEPHATIAEVLVSRTTAVLPSVDTWPVAAPAFFLPYANGPPGSRLA